MMMSLEDGFLNCPQLSYETQTELNNCAVLSSTLVRTNYMKTCLKLVKSPFK